MNLCRGFVTRIFRQRRATYAPAFQIRRGKDKWGTASQSADLYKLYHAPPVCGGWANLDAKFAPPPLPPSSPSRDSTATHLDVVARCATKH